MATHSSILAWRIPGTEESSGLLSMGSQSQTRLKRLSSSSIVDLQYSISFRHIAVIIVHNNLLQDNDHNSLCYIVYSFFLILFSIMVYYRILNIFSLYYTIGPCCLSTLYTIVSNLYLFYLFIF